MSSPQEDKPNASDTMETPTPAGPPTVVSVSGPLVAPGEAEWAGEGLMVRYAGRSAVGLVREHNEDNFVIANLTTGEPGAREASLIDLVGEGGLLFAVCDGMGGAAAGEVASQMAVDVLQEAMRRGGIPREREVLARRLVAAVEEAGRRIFDSAQKERSRRGMGTTATAAVLVDKVLFLAEVGDSRAYLLRGGELKQITKDQSLVNQLIEAGHLTEAEAEAFEHSNIILQALGTSETVQVDLTFVELRRGDRLMLCSDGLSGLVGSDTLREALACIDDPAECTAALIRFAEESGGHDNITVVVIDFQGDALSLPSENDSFGYVQYPLAPAANGGGESEFSEEEVTEAATPTGRASYDTVPSYEPGAGPSVAVDGNPWLWVSAGLTALLVGAWLLAASGSSGNALNERSAASRTATDGAAEAADHNLEKSADLARNAGDAKVVAVRVFSDVADDEAVLLVNGESRGKLIGGQGQDGRARTMELVPGAYRFEAQSHGNIAAVEVVTVQQDAPLDVYLKVPSVGDEPDQAPPDAPTNAATPTAVPDNSQGTPAQAGPEAEAAPGVAAPSVAAPDGKAQEATAEGQPAAPAPGKATPDAKQAALHEPAGTGQNAPAPAAATPEAATAPGKPAPEAAKTTTATGAAKTPTKAAAPAAGKTPAAAPEPKRTPAVAAVPKPARDHRHKPAAEPSSAAHSEATPAPKPADDKPTGPLPDNPF